MRSFVLALSLIDPGNGGFERNGLISTVTLETSPSRALGIPCLRASTPSELMRVLISVATISLLLILNGCEVSTTARIHQGPSFSLDGSGHLSSFTVYAPQPGRRIATPNDAKSEVWSFRTASGNSRGERVASMNLLYGRVPIGYVQTVPSGGVASALTTGLVYFFIAETTGSTWAHGFFYIDQNKPIPINVPGLCPSAFVGDVKPVKCGTQEPYSEPQDLELFVREHRLD
jgi:hypothetical protein